MTAAATLAVSNIAWGADDEGDVSRALSDLGVRAVEIAPTKVFTDPTDVTDLEARAYRRSWNSLGIEIVAFQSILFGHPELRLFADPESRVELIRVSGRFLQLAERLGARRIVFGSPKQRRVPEGMAEDTAWAIALEVFTQIAEDAERCGVVFCIEPNPEAYECNFVTDAATGVRLVREVSRPGFGLHLDMAGMLLAGDDPHVAVTAAATLLRHVHASAPFLGPLDDEVVDYASCLSALSEIDYRGCVSIEMRPAPDADAVSAVTSAVQTVRRAAARAGISV